MRPRGIGQSSSLLSMLVCILVFVVGFVVCFEFGSTVGPKLVLNFLIIYSLHKLFYSVPPMHQLRR